MNRTKNWKNENPNLISLWGYWVVSALAIKFLLDGFNYLFVVRLGLRIENHFLAALVTGSISGLVVGFFQWLVLRKYVNKANLWFIFTFTGYILMALLNAVLMLSSFFPYLANRLGGEYFYLFDIFLAVFHSLVIGVFQWFALKQWLSKAYLWILILLFATLLEYFIFYIFHVNGLWWFIAMVEGFGLVWLFKNEYDDSVDEAMLFEGS